MQAQITITSMFLNPITLNMGDRIVVEVNDHQYHGVFIGIKVDIIYIRVDDVGEIGFFARDITGIYRI